MHTVADRKEWIVAEAKVRVILDTDIGDDIDGTWALAMALKCPEMDLKMVVTAPTSRCTGPSTWLVVRAAVVVLRSRFVASRLGWPAGQ